MGVVNTYLEKDGVEFPLGGRVSTWFRSSSSSFRRDATFTVQTNSTQPLSLSNSSTSGSASAGTSFTLLSTDLYTSSTSSGSNGDAAGSSTLSDLSVNNSAVSTVASSNTYERASTVETTISNRVDFASFSDLKPTVVSVSKSLFLKESPYWWSIGKTEITTTTNEYTTTDNTSETTFTRKTQDTGGATSEASYPMVGSTAGSAITKNKLPNIVVAGSADVFSYQIFSARGEKNVAFSDAYVSLKSPARVSVKYNITNDSIRVFTITGSDHKPPSTSSLKNIFDYGEASSSSTGSNFNTLVFATQSYWRNASYSMDPVVSEWVKVPGSWATGTLYFLGVASSLVHRGTTTRPEIITAAAISTVPCLSYLEDISGKTDSGGLVQFVTSYTYEQNGKTKTRYFDPVATTIRGTLPKLYTTTVASTISLQTIQVLSTSTSTTGEEKSPGFTATFSSSRISVEGLTAKKYWYDFSLGYPINIFYQGGVNRIPLVAFCKSLPKGFLGFIGSYSDARALKAYRNIKVNTFGRPFGSVSFNIYDLTELFLEARRGGTVFYPKFYRTFRDFTVVGSGINGSLQTSAELSVIYSRTSTTSQTRTTTTNSSYNSTGITKSRDNTSVNVGTTTQVKTYKKSTTTNTTRNTVELTTVTYNYELDAPVDTTGFTQNFIQELDFLSHIKGVRVPLGLNRIVFSRGIVGEFGGLGDTTMHVANCSLDYTVYNSTGGTSVGKSAYTNISKAESFVVTEKHIIHLEARALYTTFKTHGDTPNIPINAFLGLTTSVNGFTFL